MPLHKKQIFLLDTLNCLFEGESVVNIPHSQEVIHASSHQPFSRGIELAEFYRLSVAWQFHHEVSLEISCWLSFFLFLLLVSR